MNDKEIANAVGLHIGQGMAAVNKNLEIVIQELARSDPQVVDRITNRLDALIEANPQLPELAMQVHTDLLAKMLRMPVLAEE